MWFIIDRDESDDSEVRQMISRLGGRARLAVLDCRELENHLLDPGALTAFINAKLIRSDAQLTPPASAEVSTAIDEEAGKLKEEAIRLRVERRLLRPVFLHSRASTGTVAERLQAGKEDLTGRMDSIEAVKEAVSNEISADWPSRARFIAPGCKILEAVSKRFGTTFSKERGDSEQLARLLPSTAIPQQMHDLLREISED